MHRTVSTSDLTMVDLDATGTVLGVEFAVPVYQVDARVLDPLRARFPAAADAVERALAP